MHFIWLLCQPSQWVVYGMPSIKVNARMNEEKYFNVQERNQRICKALKENYHWLYSQRMSRNLAEEKNSRVYVLFTQTNYHW